MGSILSLIERPQYEHLDLSRINAELGEVKSRLTAAESALVNERTKRKSYEVVNQEHREELGKQTAQIAHLEMLEHKLEELRLENATLADDNRKLIEENRLLQLPAVADASGRISDTALQHYVAEIVADPHNELKFVSQFAQKKIYSVIFTEILSSLGTLEMPVAGHVAKIQLVANRETGPSTT